MKQKAKQEEKSKEVYKFERKIGPDVIKNLKKKSFSEDIYNKRKWWEYWSKNKWSDKGNNKKMEGVKARFI